MTQLKVWRDPNRFDCLKISIADGSRYKFWGIVALFVQFGTIFMMKAKEGKMKCYNTSDDNTYIYMEGK